jgi:hypothetical protein
MKKTMVWVALGLLIACQGSALACGLDGGGKLDKDGQAIEELKE